MNSEVKKRVFTLERARDESKEDSYIVKGYALKYEPYILYYDHNNKPVYEEFRKGAFANTDITDVIMQLNHEGRVIARTSNNTLKLLFDDVGLYIEADLSSTDYSKEIYRDIEAELLSKMSWSFTDSVRVDFLRDEEKQIIVHSGIRKIYDVSVVSVPANNETEISQLKRQFEDSLGQGRNTLLTRINNILNKEV